MNKDFSDALWLNEAGICRIEHLAEFSGLTVEEIADLVDNGVITPTDRDTQVRSFQLSAILTVKTARRLRDDFQLDKNGMTLALTLLQRIRELEQEINARSALAPVSRPGERPRR